MLVSVVIPCYRSEHSIRRVVEMVSDEFSRLPGYECDFFLVDDCSPDDTIGTIRRLVAADAHVQGVDLAKNFGQHAALMAGFHQCQPNGIMCGLNHADGDLILGMDDDLQTHPSQIPVLIHKMEEGFDVVYGIYRASANGPIKNFTSWLNRWTAQKLLERPKDVETSNFWLKTRAVRDQVVSYRNYNPYIQALFGCVTKRVGNVEIEHHEREEGSSGYTLGKLIKLWLSYFNYTVVPLRAISCIGAASAFVGFVYAVYVIIKKVMVPDVPAGWSSIVCILLLFFGLILLTLGIIGEYIGNLVLPANGTPHFIVRETTDDAK